MNKKRQTFTLLLILMITIGALLIVFIYGSQKSGFEEISIEDVLSLTSTRRPIVEVVIVSDEDRMLGLIATPIASWYNIGGIDTNDSDGSVDTGRYGLKPLLIAVNGELESNQNRFMENSKLNSALTMGEVDYSGESDSSQFTGTPAQIAIDVAKHVYTQAAGAIIIDYNQEGYELGVTVTPLASYLNIPVLIKDSSTSFDTLKSTLKNLGAEYVITLGNNAKDIAEKIGYKTILLETPLEINDNALIVINHRFGAINYITMTNPADTVPLQVTETNQELYSVDVNNVKVKTGNMDVDIIGESKHIQDIAIPDGINRIQIYINFTSVASKVMDPLKESVEIDPMIFAYLYDTSDRLVAYAPSFSYDVGKTYLETESFNLSGNYKLETHVFYGTRGLNTYAGTSFGVSNIEARYEISVITSTLSKPHLPLYPDVSMMAPYISAAHGGIVLADPDFELTDEDYAASASGFATGAHYETGLHEAVNRKVSYVIGSLNQTLESLRSRNLYESYLDGPAWLAILAGPNMIPQYYEPKEASYIEEVIHGTGWPTDTKYSFDNRLSVGRPLGSNVGEVSTLIARTLFYEQYAQGHAEAIKQEYGNDEDWHNNFHFLAGELGGRTGWFFWQREFAPEVEQHGFQSEEYYQNYENDRQTMIMAGAYERANYFDMMMHGNWYWYTTELNGMDSYSTSVKNSDIMKAPDDWELGPSMFLSGSCLLGRIDGIAPNQQITMAFIHAGVNAFFCATRTTGNEAKAGTIETSLLYQDVSTGEALRLDKTENTDPPAFYVRMLFGDPAFNPYEPENGYSDQGRPELIVSQKTDIESANQDDLVKVPTQISSRASSSQLTYSGPLNDFDSSFENYLNYETMTEMLTEIEANHSNIAMLISIGTTIEGRDIWAVKISDNPLESEAEPEILFTGAHHGKEWPSYEVPMYLMKYLVENYGKMDVDNDNDGEINEDVFDGLDNDEDGMVDEDEDEIRITWLVDNRQIWIVPMVNPDGVAYAHAQVEAGETNIDNLWRKNREPNVNPATGRPYPETVAGNNMWGTDLNRNYGFHWGEYGQQSYFDPTSEDYIGPVDKTDDDNDRAYNEDNVDNIDNDNDGKIDEDPRGGFSTTETQAIKKLVEEHNFVITMNFHTYGEEIYWPWMWTRELPPDEELFYILAEEMSSYNGYNFRNMSERAQQQFSRHPLVCGDSNDWMYGKHNILAYTIELGTEFIPPEEEILNMCKLHLGANLFMIEISDDPWQRKFEIQHEPLQDTYNTERYVVKAKIINPFGLELKSQGLILYYSVDGKKFAGLPMTSTGEPNEFQAIIPGQSPLSEISYYISATDKNDQMTLLPKYAPNTIISFTVLSSRGEAYPLLLITHVIFIVGAIIFVIASGYYGVRYLRTGKGINKCIQMSGITTGMVFIGGFPLGFALAYQVFGTPWTGVPFGWDITDNKTLVIFLFFAISLFLVRGTIMNMFRSGKGKRCPFRWLLKFMGRFKTQKPKPMKDSISHHRFAKLAVIGSIITVVLYLVPHSIMVSPAFSIILFGFLIGVFIIPERREKFNS
ncbi:MAG: hypothetical protein JSV49_10135 [Thermoplasmata archaeon]|nr:MAG: hypothetical protein JSV49_10135 [Thermoplasmata archaeon]